MKSREWILVSVWFLLILVLLFWPVIFQGKTLFFGDNFQLIIPQKIYAVAELRQGRIPFWNPHILGGTPFWAEINQAILYPSTILFIFLDPALALVASVLIHLFITAWAMFFLARVFSKNVLLAALAGTVWLLSQPVIMATSNLALLQTLTWLPVILGIVLKMGINEKTKIHLWLPLFLCLSILGGHPQPLIYLFIVIATLPLAMANFRTKEFWTKLLLMSFLGVMMTAVAVVPFTQLYFLSTRSEMRAAEVLGDSVHPLHLLEFLFPNFFSRIDIGMTWGIYWNSYRKASVFITWIGLIAVMGVILKKRKNGLEKWLVICALAVLFFSLGKYLPLAGWLFEFFSPLRILRNFSLLLIMWPLLVSPLIALGLENIKIRPKYWYGGMVAISIFGILMIAGMGAVSLNFKKIYDLLVILLGLGGGFHNLARDLVIVRSLFASVTVSIIGFIGFWWSLKYKGTKRYLPVLLIVGLQMLLAARALIVFATRSIFNPNLSTQALWLAENTKIQEYRTLSTNGYVPWTGLGDYWAQIMIRQPFGDSLFTQEEPKNFRELTKRKENLATDWNMPYGVLSPFGYSTFVLKNSAAYWQTDRPGEDINEVDPPPLADSRFDEQGVRYIVWDKTYIRAGEEPIDFKQLRPIFQHPDFIIFENPEALPIIHFANEAGQINNFLQTSSGIEFDFEATKSSALTLSVPYYPGWTCLDNKHECQLKETAGGMAIKLAAGSGRVRLRFMPTGWTYWIMISLFGWVIYLTILLKNRRVLRNSKYFH